MVILNQALKGETLSIYIIGAESTDWPDVLAHLVMTVLETRYNPSASMKNINLINKLMAIMGNKNAYPMVMVNKILGIKARYAKKGITVNDNDLIAHILVVAPPEYGGLLVSELTHLEGQMPGFTLAHIHQILKSHYDMTYDKAAVEATKLANKADKDVTLTNVQSAKTVAGQHFGCTCFNCSKQGHKADQCRSAKQGNCMNYAPSSMKGGCNNNKTGDSSDPKKVTAVGRTDTRRTTFGSSPETRSPNVVLRLFRNSFKPIQFKLTS
jgi:hypothetical protein